MAAKTFSLFLFLFLFSVAVDGNYYSEGKIVWSQGTITEGGSLLQLSLDEVSGSGYQFNNRFLFGTFQMNMKLVPGYSDGTVATFYLTSGGDHAQEIDLEFIGSIEGNPYRLSTNVITPGVPNREQAFNLWFDPTQDFHTYTIFWNRHQILLSVDGTPIRMFANATEKGAGYLKNIPMTLTMTIWHAVWAETVHPINWTHAPFTVSYREYGFDACVWENGESLCPESRVNWWDKLVDPDERETIKSIQKKHMVYNYCDDPNHTPLPECSLEL